MLLNLFLYVSLALLLSFQRCTLPDYLLRQWYRADHITGYSTQTLFVSIRPSDIDPVPIKHPSINTVRRAPLHIQETTRSCVSHARRDRRPDRWKLHFKVIARPFFLVRLMFEVRAHHLKRSFVVVMIPGYDQALQDRAEWRFCMSTIDIAYEELVGYCHCVMLNRLLIYNLDGQDVKWYKQGICEMVGVKASMIFAGVRDGEDEVFQAR